MKLTEDQEQAAFVDWMNILGIKHYAVANGGHRDPREAAKLKRCGVVPGVPDMVLPYARGGFHGAYIEMKRADGIPSDIRASQREWLAFLTEQGYYATACFGCDSAINAVKWYMGLESKPAVDVIKA